MITSSPRFNQRNAQVFPYEYVGGTSVMMPDASLSLQFLYQRTIRNCVLLLAG